MKALFIVLLLFVGLFVVGLAYTFIELFIKGYPYNIRRWKFNKRFNWLLKHKSELPLSDEEKEMICERNRRYIGIDDDFYKEMKRYVRKHQ